MSKDNSVQPGDFKSHQRKAKDREDKNSSDFGSENKRLLMLRNMLIDKKKEKKPYFVK